MYNQYDPPKAVGFISSWIVELVERKIYCGVELLIDGPYRKHNNNYGYVDDIQRSTPQAFSHFTYEISEHRVLICDIQGVNDLYTDPQIHSIDGDGFGKGNMGEKGISQFLNTHRCNAICRYLKLVSINAKLDFVGTMPARRYMKHQGIDTEGACSTLEHFQVLIFFAPRFCFVVESLFGRHLVHHSAPALVFYCFCSSLFPSTCVGLVLSSKT